MPYIGMPTEYEDFLQQSNMDVDNEPINPVSAEWIGEDTDDEASQMTDGEDEEDNNPRASRARSFGSVSGISDFSLSDTDDEDEDEEHVCYVCGNMFGRRWSSMPNTEMYVCRGCLTCDINNINDTNVRTWLSNLGPDGVQDIILLINLI